MITQHQTKIVCTSLSICGRWFLLLLLLFSFFWQRFFLTFFHQKLFVVFLSPFWKKLDGKKYFRTFFYFFFVCFDIPRLLATSFPLHWCEILLFSFFFRNFGFYSIKISSASPLRTTRTNQPTFITYIHRKGYEHNNRVRRENINLDNEIIHFNLHLHKYNTCGHVCMRMDRSAFIHFVHTRYFQSIITVVLGSFFFYLRNEKKNVHKLNQNKMFCFVLFGSVEGWLFLCHVYIMYILLSLAFFSLPTQIFSFNSFLLVLLLYFVVP